MFWVWAPFVLLSSPNSDRIRVIKLSKLLIYQKQQQQQQQQQQKTTTTVHVYTKWLDLTVSRILSAEFYIKINSDSMVVCFHYRNLVCSISLYLFTKC